MFIINNRWSTQKPPVGTQIDWGHPLANGLTTCLISNPFPIDLVNNIGTPLTPFNIRQIINYKTAYGGTFSSSQLSKIDSSSSGFSNIRTIFVRGAFGATPTGWQGGKLIGNTYWVAGNNNGGWVLSYEYLPTNICFFHFNNNDGINNRVRWASSGNLNKVNSYCIRNQIAVSTSDVYLNGAYNNISSVDWGGYKSGGSTAWTIGSLSNSCQAYTAEVYTYKRFLTPSEIKWLHTEPYCFLKPIVRRFYSISGQAPTETRLLQKIIIPSNSKIGIRDGVKMVWRY